MPPFSVDRKLAEQKAWRDPAEWQDILIETFDDLERTSGFLPLAEEALLAHPADPVILCLAATAALLDERADRALAFLKRYAKRYVPTDTHHLLSALALAQQNKLGAARVLVERHRMTIPFHALRAFPGGWERYHWMPLWFDRTMG